MGLIRLLLALSVVSAHQENHFIFYLVGGTVAVKNFLYNFRFLYGNDY